MRAYVVISRDDSVAASEVKSRVRDPRNASRAWHDAVHVRAVAVLQSLPTLWMCSGCTTPPGPGARRPCDNQQRGSSEGTSTWTKWRCLFFRDSSQSTDFILQVRPGYRLQTPDYRSQSPEYRLQATDYRVQVWHYRLQTQVAHGTGCTAARAGCFSCCSPAAAAVLLPQPLLPLVSAFILLKYGLFSKLLGSAVEIIEIQANNKFARTPFKNEPPACSCGV